MCIFVDIKMKIFPRNFSFRTIHLSKIWSFVQYSIPNFYIEHIWTRCPWALTPNNCIPPPPPSKTLGLNHGPGPWGHDFNKLEHQIHTLYFLPQWLLRCLKIFPKYSYIILNKSIFLSHPTPWGDGVKNMNLCTCTVQYVCISTLHIVPLWFLNIFI